MHFSRIFSLALVGIAAAAPSASFDADEEALALVRRQYPVLECSHKTGGLHLIAAGGANTDYQKDYGYLRSTADSILNAIPGSTNVSLPYNKVLSGTPKKLAPGAIAGGMSTLKAYIVHYHASCPKTKIALIGYSSGGVIIMNDLCYGGDGVKTPQINPLLVNKILTSVVVYGEETRVTGQSYNRGTCNGYNAVVPRQNPGLCAPFANILQSYCDLTDPDCCVGSGDSPTIHFSYPATYNAAATQFTVDKFRAAGGA